MSFQKTLIWIKRCPHDNAMTPLEWPDILLTGVKLEECSLNFNKLMILKQIGGDFRRDSIELHEGTACGSSITGEIRDLYHGEMELYAHVTLHSPPATPSIAKPGASASSSAPAISNFKKENKVSAGIPASPSSSVQPGIAPQDASKQRLKLHGPRQSAKNTSGYLRSKVGDGRTAAAESSTSVPPSRLENSGRSPRKLIDPASEGESALPPPIPDLKKRKAIPQTRAASSAGMLEDGNETAQDEPEAKYRIRFGCETHKAKSSNEIQFTSVAVAEIVHGQQELRFLLVDTWLVNGMQLGHYEDATKIDLSTMDVELDAPFKGFVRTDRLIQVLRDMLNGDQDKQRPRPKKKAKLDPSKEAVEPLPPPVEPRYASTGTPAGLSKDTSRARVNTVVSFRNLTGTNVDLEHLANHQTLEKHNVTYENFKNYMLTGDDSWEGGITAYFPGLDDGDLEIEIWVLPQIDGVYEMYCWDRLTRRTRDGQLTTADDPAAARVSTISDWLNADLKKDYGKRLYIEVHIKPKEEKRRVVETTDKAKKKSSKGKERA